MTDVADDMLICGCPPSKNRSNSKSLLKGIKGKQTAATQQ